MLGKRTASEASTERERSRRARVAERVFDAIRKRGDEVSATDIVKATRGLTDYAVRLALSGLEADGRLEARKVLRAYKSVRVLTTVYRLPGVPLRLDWGQASDRGDEVHKGLGIADQKEIEARIEAERLKKQERGEQGAGRQNMVWEWEVPRGRDISSLVRR